MTTFSSELMAQADSIIADPHSSWTHFLHDLENVYREPRLHLAEEIENRTVTISHDVTSHSKTIMGAFLTFVERNPDFMNLIKPETTGTFIGTFPIDELLTECTTGTDLLNAVDKLVNDIMGRVAKLDAFAASSDPNLQFNDIGHYGTKKPHKPQLNVSPYEPPHKGRGSRHTTKIKIR